MSQPRMPRSDPGGGAKVRSSPVSPRPTAPANTGSSQPRAKARPEDFIFGKLIGEGSFSCVFLAREVAPPRREVAIKVCDKRQIVAENKTVYIHREKEILALLSSSAHWNAKRPYFVRLHSTIQDAERLYFVITYAKNGDLLRLINKLSSNSGEDALGASSSPSPSPSPLSASTGAASSAMANAVMECPRFYSAELLSAVEFLHEKGIIHRDLKVSTRFDQKNGPPHGVTIEVTKRGGAVIAYTNFYFLPFFQL